MASWRPRALVAWFSSALNCSLLELRFLCEVRARLFIDIIAIVAGLIILAWSADRFVSGASSVARHLGMSPLTVGLTIVGLGTSFPEFLVSALAAYTTKTPEMAVGNAIGSNISNIALVLGGAALVAPLNIQSRVLRREVPILLAATLLTLMLCIDQNVTQVDGVILLCATAMITYWLFNLGKRNPQSHLSAEYAASPPKYKNVRTSFVWLFIGLILLIGSSKLLVFGAENIATRAGFSRHVVGLTILAIGTSLPELAASLAAAVKKEFDILIGNIIGSNVFNTLAVIGIAGLIGPGGIPETALSRDFLVMVVLTLIFFAIAYGFGDQGMIGRFEGGVLLLSFCAYYALIYLTTKTSPQ